MRTQKEIAQILDRAAARATISATAKQCWLLAGLWAAQANEIDADDWALNGEALDVKTASALIEIALRQKEAA